MPRIATTATIATIAATTAQATTMPAVPPPEILVPVVLSEEAELTDSAELLPETPLPAVARKNESGICEPRKHGVQTSDEALTIWPLKQAVPSDTASLGNVLPPEGQNTKESVQEETASPRSMLSATAATSDHTHVRAPAGHVFRGAASANAEQGR